MSACPFSFLASLFAAALGGALLGYTFGAWRRA
jgi:hypothetical protein